MRECSKTVGVAPGKLCGKYRMRRIRVADFFCGCGGTSAGLNAAGLTLLVGIDHDHDAAQTFRSNFPRVGMVERPIETIRPKDLVDFIPKHRSFPLLFSACAPCQPFSKQNKARVRRITRTHEASLLDHLHRFISFFRPEYVFIENVPGLQRISDRTGPFARFVRFLEAKKYCFDHSVVKAQDYGVPQRRERLVLLASRLGEIKIPDPTHGPGKTTRKYSTVWEWIGDLPPLQAGESHPLLLNHRARALSDTNLKRIRSTPPGGDRRSWPRSLLLDCHRSYDGHTDVYGRLDANRPAPALTTKCITLSNGRFGHPNQDRAISVREAADLQTFPRSFVFQGSLASMARQIGNAVPVLMAQVIGESISQHFHSHPCASNGAPSNG
jgi:DNA (cytosine-5)-methyltransferase 1